MKFKCPLCGHIKEVTAANIDRENIAESRPRRLMCNWNGCRGWCPPMMEGD